MGSIYGFDLPPAERPLRHGRPPERALRWCERAVGPVRSVRALPGGASSAVHLIQARGAFVLRRYVRAAWLGLEPDLAEHEARVLELLAGTAVPAPRLVAL